MQSSSAAKSEIQATPPPERLDTRGLPAPENILAVLRKVDQLPPNSVLELRADSNPYQLYDLLQQRGFWLTMIKEGDGCFRGIIRPKHPSSRD